MMLAVTRTDALGRPRLLTPLEWVGRAVLAAADKKAKDIVVIDVGDILAITDHFLICSARSDRQVKTIAEEIERKLSEAKRKPLRTEGTPDTGWILLDYGDFVVHVFSDEMRELLRPRAAVEGRSAARPARVSRSEARLGLGSPGEGSRARGRSSVRVRSRRALRTPSTARRCRCSVPGSR